MTQQNSRKVFNMTAKKHATGLAGVCLLCILLLQACLPLFAAPDSRPPVGGDAAADTIIVARDGSGKFTSIQKAIEDARSYPLKPVVIYIKKGVYNEQVRIPAWNPDITLVGEDRNQTIIRFGSYFGQVDKGRNSTFYTSTLSVEAEHVVCRHLTIENTAGPVGQAIALSVSADRCLIDDCTIKGNQDTFFATGSHTHVWLKDCDISGTTDFLFFVAVLPHTVVKAIHTGQHISIFSYINLRNGSRHRLQAFFATEYPVTQYLFGRIACCLLLCQLMRPAGAFSGSSLSTSPIHLAVKFRIISRRFIGPTAPVVPAGRRNKISHNSIKVNRPGIGAPGPA